MEVNTDKYGETLYLHYEINANEMHDYKCFARDCNGAENPW